MPMVPTFQGNVPRVRDTGGSGMVAAQQVRPQMDYASVMKEALKPINDAAQTVSEVLKINHARTVKAESDDAENMVIQTINTYMNDPENGYMTKRGKNAMDSFQPTVEKMQADINHIVGQLQPATRDAIQSRISDRFNSAIARAQSWNTRQTLEYHLDSSKARVETLMDDAANNYADANYLAKTWASIEDELNFQTADYAGMPPEAAKQLKDQTFALFQSKRFEAWAQDDPVTAFAAFRNEAKHIDRDVAQKIGNSLFGKSRDLLAYDLANVPIQYDKDGEPVNAKWMDDPRARTGHALIDSLPPDQHLSVVSKAMSMRRSMTSGLRNSMKLETANSLARVLTTGQDDNPLTLDQFVEVYGPKEGQKNFDQYRMDFDYNQTMYDFRSMSNEDMRSLLKSEKPPVESDNYAKEYKYWEGKVKAAAEIQKQRTADPVGWAIENKIWDYKPLNFQNQGELFDQLKLRTTNLENMKSQWGVPDTIMSKAEAKQLVSMLDQSDIEHKLQLLDQISVATGADGVRALSEQLKSGNTMYAMAVAGMEDSNDSGSISVGEMYLRGKDAIEQKRVKVDTAAMYGLEASIYNTLGDEDGAEAVFTSPQAMNATAELVKGVYGYEALNGGSARDAIEQSVGVIYNHNGKKIVLPKNVRGFTLMGDDFDDLVMKQAKEIRKGKKNYYAAGLAISPEELADMLPQMKLQTYSRNGNAMTYQVIFNGDEVRDSDGNVFLLSIGGEQQ